LQDQFDGGPLPWQPHPPKPNKHCRLLVLQEFPHDPQLLSVVRSVSHGAEQVP
jgi:hypothetical protein